VRLHVHKANLSEVEKQLTRIADLLEGLLNASNQQSLPLDAFPEDKTERVTYHNDKDEIVEYHVQRLGRNRT
jgi:hypothetical protein